jgi:hypothetical protein
VHRTGEEKGEPKGEGGQRIVTGPETERVRKERREGRETGGQGPWTRSSGLRRGIHGPRRHEGRLLLLLHSRRGRDGWLGRSDGSCGRLLSVAHPPAATTKRSASSRPSMRGRRAHGGGYEPATGAGGAAAGFGTAGGADGFGAAAGAFAPGAAGCSRAKKGVRQRQAALSKYRRTHLRRLPREEVHAIACTVPGLDEEKVGNLAVVEQLAKKSAEGE